MESSILVKTVKHNSPILRRFLLVSQLHASRFVKNGPKKARKLVGAGVAKTMGDAKYTALLNLNAFCGWRKLV